MNIVGDMCDSEECLNDTYIGAWNSIPPSRPAVLRSFLGSIMRRTAIDRFRANRRQKRIASEFIVSLSEIEDIIADDSDMNAVTEAEELAKSINDFVRALPNRRMYVFVARYYLADPIAKIGDELGCSISTVKREIEAIRTGLRKHLEGEGYII